MKLKESREGLESVYLSVLRILRKMIELDYADGGRLPSVRKMCETIECNHITYNKAISYLIAEGVISNQYQRGMFVIPERFRCRKIGVIIGDGEVTPFLSTGLWFSKLIEKLYLSNIHIKIIQESKAEKILNCALVHCVDCVVWLGKTPSILKEAQIVANACYFPIIVANYFSESVIASTAYPLLPAVNYDMKMVGQERVKFFVAQKYKSVVYVGDSKADDFMQFTETLNNLGVTVKKEHILPTNILEIEERLPKILSKNSIDVIFSEGGETLQKAILDCCKNLSSKDMPDIIFNKSLQTLDLIKEYPEFENIYLETSECDGGSICAEIVLDYLYHKKPFTSKNAPIDYKITKR